MDFITENLSQLEEGLRLKERQMSTDVDRIDVLAEDKNGDLVVTELKVKGGRVAGDRTAPQILSYESWSSGGSPSGRK